MRPVFRMSLLMAVSCLTMALVSAPVATAPAPTSCYVSIVQLSDPPLTEYPDGGVSVRIYNGASRLFETPIKPLSKPAFTNRITFFTAKSMPVRLVVVVWPGEGEPGDPVARDNHSGHRDSGSEGRASSVRDSDADVDVLGIGFENLIGDYETWDSAGVPENHASAPPKKKVVKPEKTRSRGGVVLCDTAIDWPPADGRHMVQCGASQLLVRTEMIVRGTK